MLFSCCCTCYYCYCDTHNYDKLSNSKKEILATDFKWDVYVDFLNVASVNKSVENVNSLHTLLSISFR